MWMFSYNIETSNIGMQDLWTCFSALCKKFFVLWWDSAENDCLWWLKLLIHNRENRFYSAWSLWGYQNRHKGYASETYVCKIIDNLLRGKNNVANPGEVLKGEYSGWLQANWHFSYCYTPQLCQALPKFPKKGLCLTAGVLFKHSLLTWLGKMS